MMLWLTFLLGVIVGGMAHKMEEELDNPFLTIVLGVSLFGTLIYIMVVGLLAVTK
jgi:hypothetical protein